MTTTRMSVSESEHRRRILAGADDSGKHDALHTAHQRIQQLEKQCATLAAQVDRQAKVVHAAQQWARNDKRLLRIHLRTAVIDYEHDMAQVAGERDNDHN